MVTNVLKVMNEQKQSSDISGNNTCRAQDDSRESNNGISGIAGDSGSECNSDFEDDFVLKASSGMFTHGPAAYVGKNPSVVVNSWIDHSNQNIDWSQFLRSSSNDNDVNASAGQATHKLSFNNLLTRLQECDPMLWFNQVGKTVFPEVAILVRLEFAKVDSSAVQERMFSAASAAMTIKQTKMSREVHEKRTVLFANKDFMRKVGKF